MNESVLVDPNYEYEAPQFYDFNKGPADEDDHVDSWFDGKPDDEGGVSIPEDFQPEAEDESKQPQRITRNQKRNNVLKVSASSGIPSKKQKGMPEHGGDSGSESGKTKRSQLLCSNPEKKLPTVTIPITPQCLKRQKTAKPIIKLKTSEEMEMERIAEMRKKTKNHIKANEHSMKKAISCTSYHPVRTRTEPTQPQEFQFETDKRVKPHAMTTRADDAEKEFLKSLRQHTSPVKNTTWKHRGVTVPKPFNLSSGNSTKRIHSTMEKDNQDTYETMAYHVYKFQTTTPPRFRTKKANEPKPELIHDAVKKPTPKVTCPKTPSLSTKSRARPVAADVLSKEEKEEKEVAAMKSYQFKARPFDRRIVESEGLFGVKTANKKELTQVVAFSFESDERLEARKQQQNTTECQEEENVVPFKALSQPNFNNVFQPQLEHKSTAPKPFSFEEKDKERWQKKR